MSAATRQIKANPATKDLWRIAETDDIDELQELLARGADINASDVNGMTALMRAAQHGRLNMVRALIACGADPNATRSDKFT
ncbi:MAG: ankyrin repeat domain-containing protein, partial [Pyrinomonadaceae bacterium]